MYRKKSERMQYGCGSTLTNLGEGRVKNSNEVKTIPQRSSTFRITA
jgi:hypothetical protein